jgi:hypothetical protein
MGSRTSNDEQHKATPAILSRAHDAPFTLGAKHLRFRRRKAYDTSRTKAMSRTSYAMGYYYTAKVRLIT